MISSAVSPPPTSVTRMFATSRRCTSSVNNAGRAATARPSTVKASAVPLRSVIVPRWASRVIVLVRWASLLAA